MENEQIINDTVEHFIDIIGYAVDYTSSINDLSPLVYINLTGENLGGLIGYHGKNISSIEHILNLMVSKQIGEHRKFLTLDINAYRQERLDTMKRYVLSAINKVQKNHKPYDLYPMSAYERLYVHKLVTEYPDMETVSHGEEPNRLITIKIKDQSDSLEELL